MDASLNEIIIKLNEMITMYPELISKGIMYWAIGIISTGQFNKFILIKENKNTDSKVISETPQILKKEIKTIIPPEELKELINEFTTTLNTTLNHEQYETIKTNISNLKYKKENIDSIMHLLHGAAGSYSPSNNTIAINKFSIAKCNKLKLKHIIFHELLHASSTKNIDNKKIFLGFNQAMKKNNRWHSIGIGINEGYTDYLATNIFNIGRNKTSVGYPYEAAIAEYIEFIVGENKMKEFYFNSDLKGLCAELAKYEDINNIKQFIVNLDTIRKLKNLKIASSKEEIGKLEISIDNFLINIHKNKQNRNFNLRTNYNEDTLKSYFKEEDKFTTLFSKIEKYKKIYNNHILIQYLKKQKEILLSQKNNQLETHSKAKTLGKKKNGYINIIILITIIIISILLAILILKIK